MRSSVRLIRVKRPTDLPIEADLTLLDEQTACVTTPYTEGELEEALQEGERLIIEWLNDDKRARGVISALSFQPFADPGEGQQGAEWSLTLTVSLKFSEPDARHYPRLLGGIHLRFRLLDAAISALDTDQWLAGGKLGGGELEGGELEGGLALMSPLDELMDFSVHGLSFESATPLEESALVLCEVGVAKDELRWRCCAKVARVWRAREGVSVVALQFISPPEALSEALSDYTLELQRASL